MTATLESIYQAHLAGNRAITAHLPRLRRLAAECSSAVEFGVKHGTSSTALLAGLGDNGREGRLTSYDLVPTDEARHLAQVAGSRWDYRIADSRTANVPACDLLFIDSLHTHAQCLAELRAHASKVRRMIAFHDTITFGSVGADGETGRQLWDYSKHVGVSVPREALGIRPAIDWLMIHDPTWRVWRHWTDAHGLLVLRRDGAPPVPDSSDSGGDES